MTVKSSGGHGQKVALLFNNIAGWYDFLNHFLSGGLDIYWRKRLVRSMSAQTGEPILDLAAGTLDVSLEISRKFPGHKIWALDFSELMLRKGQKKLQTGFKHNIFPVLADAKQLPLVSNSVGCASIAFGIRNILPRNVAYTEILRVLRPGGKLCILEFGSSRNKICKGLYNFYLNRLLPVIGKLVSRDEQAYRYLADTIAGFPTARELGYELRQAGFENITYVPLCWGIVYLHIAKKSGPSHKNQS